MRFFLSSVFLLAAGCRNPTHIVDVTGSGVRVEVERFDQLLFGVATDTLEQAIGPLYDLYAEFFDVFNVHIINIGQASSKHYPSYLSMFINDPTNREVYRYTSELFGGMEEINNTLSSGFSHYLFHYPDSVPPRVVGYVSRFNQGLFTVGRFVGIGLDQYLGSDCPYYKKMGVPLYLLQNKVPGRIPVDVMLAWASRDHPYNDSLDNVLNRMIYNGMLAYFVDAMYPGMEESFKMGFSDDQLKWCRNNESQMWTFLVEEKLLFSTDPLVIRKLTEAAPHTGYFTTESPGRAAVWVGLQIVRSFAERNRDLSLPQLMQQCDYQELLRKSRYNP
jgi:hypothetical protein